jgi:carbon-monoxide dehydrogenase medium subunit
MATEAGKILAEKPITAEVIAKAAQAAMDSCSPIDDVRGSGRYRKFMVRNLTQRGVTEVFDAISQQ